MFIGFVHFIFAFRVCVRFKCRCTLNYGFRRDKKRKKRNKKMWPLFLPIINFNFMSPHFQPQNSWMLMLGTIIFQSRQHRHFLFFSWRNARWRFPLKNMSEFELMRDTLVRWSRATASINDKFPFNESLWEIGDRCTANESRWGGNLQK